jgi:DNA-binding transcriptional regulator YhcF (GntR family)
MSNYYVQTYGAFIKDHEKRILEEKENKYLNEYARKWKNVVERLKESGVDLSQIKITKKEK